MLKCEVKVRRTPLAEPSWREHAIGRARRGASGMSTGVTP